MFIKVDTWTWLPRLGKDAFSQLMRLGVKYDKRNGFYIPSSIDLREVASVIEKATGKNVNFVFKCFMCGKDMTCIECEYKWSCKVELTSGKCICSNCMKKIDMKDYVTKWASLV